MINFSLNFVFQKLNAMDFAVEGLRVPLRGIDYFVINLENSVFPVDGVFILFFLFLRERFFN